MRIPLAMLLLALGALFVPPKAAAQLDCWVPTRESAYVGERLTIKSAEVAPMRRTLLAIHEMIRNNPHYKAMQRPIRIRTTISVGGVAPLYGQLNTVAYRPDVWADRGCDVVPGADRCCTDGNVTVLVNPREILLQHAGHDDRLAMFVEPKLTGEVGGFPEYGDLGILISRDRRMPWVPVTVAEYLDYQERRLNQDLAKFNESKANPPGYDEAQIHRVYESMKKADPNGAEKFLVSMKQAMAQVPEQNRKRFAAENAYLERQFNELRTLRASFSARDLARQARHGTGPLNLAPPDAPNSSPLVKYDPTFWDEKDRNRIQLIRVSISYLPIDEVTERRETMKRTKETLDYKFLAGLLR